MPSDLGEIVGDDWSHQLPDIDPLETQEWLDSLDAVAAEHGPVRARFILARLLERAHDEHLGIPVVVTTPYINTIPASLQPDFPGDADIERRIRRFIRWNAAVMVVTSWTSTSRHTPGTPATTARSRSARS